MRMASNPHRAVRRRAYPRARHKDKAGTRTLADLIAFYEKPSEFARLMTLNRWERTADNVIVSRRLPRA